MNFINNPIGRLRYLGYSILYTAVAAVAGFYYFMEFGATVANVDSAKVLLIGAIVFGITSLIIAYKRLRDITLNKYAPLVFFFPILTLLLNGLFSPSLGYASGPEMGIMKTLLSIANFIIAVGLLVIPGKKPQVIEQVVTPVPPSTPTPIEVSTQ